MINPITIKQQDILGDDRYYPSDDELKILIPNLKQYFNLPERSMERKTLVQKTYELVKEKNPTHWEAKKVRIWFRNNKKTYISIDPERIPTAQIPPLPATDPNFSQNTELLENRGLPKPAFSFRQPNQQVQPPQFDLGLPQLPELTPGWNDTQESYQNVLQEHYNLLKAIREKFHAIAKDGTEEERKQKQKRLETLFVQCLNQMKKQLTVNEVFSFDSFASKVYATPTKEFLNELSSSAAITSTINQYAYPQHEAEMISLSESISRNKNIHIPVDITPKYRILYTGHCEEKVLDIPGIQVSIFLSDGTFIYSFFNKETNSHSINYNGSIGEIGCFKPPTNLYCDEENKLLYIASECRIFVMSLETMTINDILFASITPLDQCMISLSETQIVIATPLSMVTYEKNPTRPTNKGMTIKQQQIERYAVPSTLDLSKVNQTKGRQGSITPPEFSNLSLICKCNNKYAIASNNYSCVHLYDETTKQLQGRIVGHTDGITCLYSYNGLLYTASKDGTAKVWNPDKCTCLTHIDRHWKKITSLYVTEIEGRILVITAGDDNIIRLWDTKGGQEILEFSKEKISIKTIFFSSDDLTLHIVYRDESDFLLQGTATKTKLLQISFTE